MKKRFVYFLLCAVSLVCGSILYIIFRPDSYVAIYVRNVVPILQTVFENINGTDVDFFKYYFPDFLWAFSFNCGLNVIFHEPKKAIINGIVVSLVGILWELAQKTGIVSGTGDIIDVLMYILAVVVLFLPNVILYKKQN